MKTDSRYTEYMTPWYNPFARASNVLATQSRYEDIIELEAATQTGIVSPWADEREGFKSIVLDQLLGTDNSTMTRKDALGIASVAAIRNTACGFISRVPLRAYNEKTGALLATQPSIIAQPEAGTPSIVTWSWTIDALLFYGRAWFLVKERGKDDRPTKLKFVPEWDAEVEEGLLVRAFDEEVKQRDVIRIDGPHEGLLNYATAALKEARAIDRAAARASDNPVPSVNLHQTGGEPMTEEEIDNMVNRWLAARRSGKGVGYTNQSVEAIAMGQPIEQLLIDGRNVAALNVARAASFPAWVVDASVSGSSMTYSNVPSRTRELIDRSLSPFMAHIEARLTMNDILPSGQKVRFDYSDLLRADFGGRMTAYKDAKESGVYTTEELKRIELGLPVTEVGNNNGAV